MGYHGWSEKSPWSLDSPEDQRWIIFSKFLIHWRLSTSDHRKGRPMKTTREKQQQQQQQQESVESQQMKTHSYLLRLYLYFHTSRHRPLYYSASLYRWTLPRPCRTGATLAFVLPPTECSGGIRAEICIGTDTLFDATPSSTLHSSRCSTPPSRTASDCQRAGKQQWMKECLRDLSSYTLICFSWRIRLCSSVALMADVSLYTLFICSMTAFLTLLRWGRLRPAKWMM